MAVAVIVALVCAGMAIVSEDKEKQEAKKYETAYKDHVEFVMNHTNAHRLGTYRQFVECFKKYRNKMDSHKIHTMTCGVTVEDKYTYWFSGRSPFESKFNIDSNDIKFDGLNFLFSSLEEYAKFSEWQKAISAKLVESEKSVEVGGTW